MSAPVLDVGVFHGMCGAWLLLDIGFNMQFLVLHGM